MGVREGSPSCVSGLHISLSLPLLRPTQCPPMTACSWQGWRHPRSPVPCLVAPLGLPPQPPCCESPLPGSRLGVGAHGWRIGGGEGARRGQRIPTFLSLEKGRGNESHLQRVLQLSLQLVLWARCVPGATPWVSLGSKVGCPSCPQPPACYFCLSGIFGIKQVVTCNAPRWCLSCGRCCGPAASTWGQALPLSSLR